MKLLALVLLLVAGTLVACSPSAPVASQETATPAITALITPSESPGPIASVSTSPTRTAVKPTIPDSPTPGHTRTSTRALTATPPIATDTPVTGTLRTEQRVGGYTIRLWHPNEGLYDHVTISKQGQPEIRIESVQAIGQLPAADINGDGYPDVMFETYEGGSHCCWGTIVYSLGPTPDKILELASTPDAYSDGRGTFQDLDGDGRYEFITQDALTGIPCSAPLVPVILRYEPGRGYIGASPRYRTFFADDIAAKTRQAEANIEQTREGYKCDVYPVIADYIYSGQAERAWSELERLYLGADRAEFRDTLLQAVRRGRFYVGP